MPRKIKETTMVWHPLWNLPDLKNYRKLNDNVYQSMQDEIYFIIIDPEKGWIGAYERYGGQARTLNNADWVSY